MENVGEEKNPLPMLTMPVTTHTPTFDSSEMRFVTQKKKRAKQSPALDKLPPELLWHICRFLDAKFVLVTLTRVCKAFYALFTDDATWKSRINRRWPRYPPISVSQSFNWKKACIALEEEAKHWAGDRHNKMTKFILPSAHIACIDAIHLMECGHICVSGSRDRSLKFWDFAKLKTEPQVRTADLLIDTIINAHGGWIWTISSEERRLCTGSWDNMLHLWDLEQGCQKLYSAKCRGAVLCTGYNGNLVVAGTYGKMTQIFDTRRGLLPVYEYSAHSAPVLALCSDKNYIITSSEDATVVVHDRRNRNILKRLDGMTSGYVMSLSYGDGYLYGGDKKGQIHLWDATDGQFRYVQSFQACVGKTKPYHYVNVTSIRHTMGVLISSGADKFVRICVPSLQQSVYCTFELNQEVADLDYMNHVLACACTNGSLIVWKQVTGSGS